jgi:hypothetical protein
MPLIDRQIDQFILAEPIAKTDFQAAFKEKKEKKPKQNTRGMK